MEFMVIAVAFILVVLGLYLFIEQSILRRYGIVETIEDAQSSLDSFTLMNDAFHEMCDELEAEARKFTLLDRITNALHW